jgi:hypothetical protein
MNIDQFYQELDSVKTRFVWENDERKVVRTKCGLCPIESVFSHRNNELWEKYGKETYLNDKDRALIMNAADGGWKEEDLEVRRTLLEILNLTEN